MGEWSPFELDIFEYEVLQLHLKYGLGYIKMYRSSFFKGKATDETALMTLEEFAKKAFVSEKFGK